MIDKTVHKDDFKLRFLLNNYCNMGCHYCLNDFQPHKTPWVALSYEPFKMILGNYLEFCKDKDLPGEVYISGGEPSLHPYFLKYIEICLGDRRASHRVVLCTNGKIREDIKRYVTRFKEDFGHRFDVHLSWHLNYRCDVPWAKAIDAKMTFIYDHDNDPDGETIKQKLNALVLEDPSYPWHVKIFDNFLAPNQEAYEILVEDLTTKYPIFDIQVRHTGIQENRGPG